MRLASASFASESLAPLPAVIVAGCAAGIDVGDDAVAWASFGVEQATDTIVMAATRESPAIPLTREVRIP